MEIVVSGLAEFAEASAAFLVTWRAPWKLALRIAREMDRAEYTRYVAQRHIPLRLTFVPQSALYPRSELRGSGFVVDLNTGMGYDSAMAALACMDEMRMHVSTACMYEHMHLYDALGHIACGALAVTTSLLTSLATFDAGEDFFSTFSNFVRHELEMRFFVDLNTGDYRDVIDRYLTTVQSAAERTCEKLLANALSVPSATALGGILRTPVTIHPMVSDATVNGLIRDSVSPKAGAGLHLAVGYGPRNAHETRPLPAGAPTDMQHHFLAVWATSTMPDMKVD